MEKILPAQLKRCAGSVLGNMSFYIETIDKRFNNNAI